MLEGGLDQVSGLGLDSCDRAIELAVCYIPVTVMLRVEDIVGEVDQFADLFIDTCTDSINRVRGACHLLKLLTENCLELLEHLAGITDVLNDLNHVDWLCENLLVVAKFPTRCASSRLNLNFSLVVLGVPLIQDDDGLVNFDECILDGLLVEDSFDVNFHAHL